MIHYFIYSRYFIWWLLGDDTVFILFTILKYDYSLTDIDTDDISMVTSL